MSNTPSHSLADSDQATELVGAVYNRVAEANQEQLKPLMDELTHYYADRIAKARALGMATTPNLTWRTSMRPDGAGIEKITPRLMVEQRVGQKQFLREGELGSPELWFVNDGLFQRERTTVKVIPVTTLEQVEGRFYVPLSHEGMCIGKQAGRNNLERIGAGLEYVAAPGSTVYMPVAVKRGTHTDAEAAPDLHQINGVWLIERFNKNSVVYKQAAEEAGLPE